MRTPVICAALVTVATFATSMAFANDRPAVESRSAIVLDAASGDELFAKDADEVRPIASTTKIFVAMAVRKHLDLDGWTEISKVDAHYAVGVAPWSFLGASVELATMVQLNRIAGMDFEKFNHIRAVWVAPALQIHAADWRIDLIARLGLSRGQELYGVLEYVGTHSFTLHVTRIFN